MIRNLRGVAAGNINVQRDGIPITGGRWPTGLQPATTINPDLVGEVRMILAPVDAELGRGSGQFQIQTRSGTINSTVALFGTRRTQP